MPQEGVKQGRTDEGVQVFSVTAVQRARQDAGDNAAEDLAEDVDPDLVPVAVEDDGWAQGTGWADGAARERSGCGEETLLSDTLLCSRFCMHPQVHATSFKRQSASVMATSPSWCGDFDVQGLRDKDR